jgi:hypothetical protein
MRAFSVPTSRTPHPISSSPGISAALILLIVLTAVTNTAADTNGARSAAGLQHLVDGLRARLGISHTVQVTIVETNPRVVSMIPPASTGEPFGLAVQGDFLNALSEDEIAAALAHELGHVWVATHHPFLQTERQANEIAMQVVTRYSLSRLYAKLWAMTGTEADLDHYLGPEILRVTRHYPVD